MLKKLYVWGLIKGDGMFNEKYFKQLWTCHPFHKTQPNIYKSFPRSIEAKKNVGKKIKFSVDGWCGKNWEIKKKCRIGVDWVH